MDGFETEKFSPLVSELDEECRGRAPPSPSRRSKTAEKNNGTQIRFEGGRKKKNFSTNFKHNFHASPEKKVKKFFCAFLGKVAN